MTSLLTLQIFSDTKYFCDTEIFFSDKYTVVEEMTSDYSTRMQLQITDFQAEDVGVYTCISTNSLGKSDGTIRFYGENDYNFFVVG